MAYMAVLLDVPKPMLYRWLQQGDLPHQDYSSLSNRRISIDGTMRVKAAKRPSRPKAR